MPSAAILPRCLLLLLLAFIVEAGEEGEERVVIAEGTRAKDVFYQLYHIVSDKKLEQVEKNRQILGKIQVLKEKAVKKGLASEEKFEEGINRVNGRFHDSGSTSLELAAELSVTSPAEEKDSSTNSAKLGLYTPKELKRQLLVESKDALAKGSMGTAHFSGAINADIFNSISNGSILIAQSLLGDYTPLLIDHTDIRYFAWGILMLDVSKARLEIGESGQIVRNFPTSAVQKVTLEKMGMGKDIRDPWKTLQEELVDLEKWRNRNSVPSRHGGA